jgi:hypothetical protein
MAKNDKKQMRSGLPFVNVVRGFCGAEKSGGRPACLLRRLCLSLGDPAAAPFMRGH